MSDRVSTKLRIAHPVDPQCTIVGILEQLSSNDHTNGRKIALILHGTMGHKDYLFQKRLALRLPIDSFRFDFRGNHETGGTWKQGALDEDLEDLAAVVDYLKTTYGYVVDLVVGHSRGSLVGLRWLCTSEEGKGVSGFVNASGRYRMHKIHGNDKSVPKFPVRGAHHYSLIPETATRNRWKESFDKQGYFSWTVSVARKQVTVKIYPQDLEDFANWDTSIVWDQFPPTVDVLTLHGLSDKTVPPYDAVIYARALSKRTPGTHTLNMIEDADHNFTGRQDEITDAIIDWWALHQRNELTTGLWLAGVKGKL